MKTALVLGAGGFIGSHLVKRLKREGYWVRGIDLKHPSFSNTEADEFLIFDLRIAGNVRSIMYLNTLKTFSYLPPPYEKLLPFDEVYQLAADMGGAGYVFTGEHDADIVHNSAMINLNVAKYAVEFNVKKIFYSSSACIYPEHNQTDPNNPNCAENTAYPANPDSEYGWEKLFSERMYKSFSRNYGLDVRIARFHNIFGIEGSWNDGREKAPAAICRKVAMADNEIEIWGDGKQTRSFLYIDECIEGVRRLMEHPTAISPVNIGSDEMVTINELANIVFMIANKQLTIKHISGPEGVRGRCSDNKEIKKQLKWEPNYPLQRGLEKTYKWITNQV